MVKITTNDEGHELDHYRVVIASGTNKLNEFFRHHNVKHYQNDYMKIGICTYLVEYTNDNKTTIKSIIHKGISESHRDTNDKLLLSSIAVDMHSIIKEVIKSFNQHHLDVERKCRELIIAINDIKW